MRAAGIRGAQRRRGRHGVDDVAERAEPDDEKGGRLAGNVAHPRIRSSRSRVE